MRTGLALGVVLGVVVASSGASAAPTVTSFIVVADDSVGTGDFFGATGPTGTLDLQVSSPSPPLTVMSCSITGGTTCSCVDTTGGNLGGWICSFAGLADGATPHTATVVVRDSLGAEVTGTETWLVDSTADVLSAGWASGTTHFDLPPFSSAAGDLFPGSGTLALTTTDTVIDIQDGVPPGTGTTDRFDSSINFEKRTGQIDANSEFPVSLMPSIVVAVEGPHTFTFRFKDAVGNPSPDLSFPFFVDLSSPVIDPSMSVLNTLDEPSEPEGFLDSTGLPITDHDGVIRFNATEPPNSAPDVWTFECAVTGPSSVPTASCTIVNGVVPEDCACANANLTAEQYEYRGLDCGTYALTVKATDGVGHATTRQKDFVVGLTVVQPNGGEYVPPGEPYLVEWCAPDSQPITAYNVYVSYDGGATFDPTPVCANLPSTDRSCLVSFAMTEAATARVRVIGSGASATAGMDTSDSDFAVMLPPPIDAGVPDATTPDDAASGLDAARPIDAATGNPAADAATGGGASPKGCGCGVDGQRSSGWLVLLVAVTLGVPRRLRDRARAAGS